MRAERFRRRAGPLPQPVPPILPGPDDAIVAQTSPPSSPRGPGVRHKSSRIFTRTFGRTTSRPLATSCAAAPAPAPKAHRLATPAPKPPGLVFFLRSQQPFAPCPHWSATVAPGGRVFGLAPVRTQRSNHRYQPYFRQDAWNVGVQVTLSWSIMSRQTGGLEGHGGTAWH